MHKRKVVACMVENLFLLGYKLWLTVDVRLFSNHRTRDESLVLDCNNCTHANDHKFDCHTVSTMLQILAKI